MEIRHVIVQKVWMKRKYPLFMELFADEQQNTSRGLKRVTVDLLTVLAHSK